MKRFLFLFAIFSFVIAEEKADSLGNKLPLKSDRRIIFTTNEGTWMSLDISPNGKSIIFDLLGDIYTIAYKGGKAKRLTSGIAFDSQPVYSPDGKNISFISDRGGSENLWIAAVNGD